jgi:hypothetical protein
MKLMCFRLVIRFIENTTNLHLSFIINNEHIYISRR